jgi:hypothetical protein
MGYLSYLIDVSVELVLRLLGKLHEATTTTRGEETMFTVAQLHTSSAKSISRNTLTVPFGYLRCYREPGIVGKSPHTPARSYLAGG